MIELKNVSKLYNSRFVLKDINLILPRYGLVIINGPSGCGKTTLLNILSSLLDFEGDVLFDGRNYKSMSSSDRETLRNKKIGFIFQDYKLFEFESVKDNILLSINLSSVDKESKKIKRAEDLLSIVDLSTKLNELVSNLSGGEKQRVAIARAIANSPSLLLADEPTGNLDEKNTEIVMEIIKKISASSLVVMVSHDEKLTKKYADRIIRMKDGKIISDRYQNQNVHKEYLPILKLKYDDKKRSLPFKFLFNHTFNYVKRRKWRSLFITMSTSLGLIGVGLASTLSNIISTNLYRSYSSIIDSDKLIISSKSPNITRDIITSATYEEVSELKTNNKDIKGIGVYYWNLDYLFPSENFLSLEEGMIKKEIGNFNASTVNEFAQLSSNKATIYPKRVDFLQENEVVMSMPMLVINELCYQLQIERTINSLSRYIEHNEVNLMLSFSNDSWGYSCEIPLKLKGFILSTKQMFYHSNPNWNEFILEKCTQLPTTNYINTNSSHPWDLKKSYYLDFSSSRDSFLMSNRFSLEFNDYDFEIMDEKYYPLLMSETKTFESPRVLAVHRTNKDDIPSFVGEYCKYISSYVHEATYGTDSGYSIYDQSLMMGFSRLTYLSSSEEVNLDLVDNMSYIKYEDSLNVVVPNDVIEGHFSKSGSSGFVFEPHYKVTSGREPASLQEILISDVLAKRLKLSNPINQMIYISFPVKEDILSNGYVSRDFETVALKITGVTDSGKLSISHKESWSILFFQVMLGISTFELRINNLAIRVEEGKENEIIEKVNRAFPQLSITAPLQDVKGSVDRICNYIEMIMLIVSIGSVIIASLILVMCNYLHFMEAKKDIGLVRCLGVKEKESRKIVYFHSFMMTGSSLLFSTVELILVSIILSKVLADSLYIAPSFVFNPLSIVYMFAVALFISLISSILISRKISKIDALECLQ